MNILPIAEDGDLARHSALNIIRGQPDNCTTVLSGVVVLILEMIVPISPCVEKTLSHCNAHIYEYVWRISIHIKSQAIDKLLLPACWLTAHLLTYFSYKKGIEPIQQ